MDELFFEMQSKGLVSIKRVPRSECLVDLIRSTNSIPYRDEISWLDWLKGNKN